MEYFGGLLWGCLCDVYETLLGLFLKILQSACGLLLLCAFPSLLIQMFTFLVGEDSEMLVRVTMMGLWDATRHLSLKGVESGNIILRKRPWIVLYVGCVRSPMYVIE